MMSVYSGGLVYEYSQEDSNYGLVKISGGQVTTMTDFNTLKGKFQKTPIPTGDGGYKSSGKPSDCPTKSKTWNVTMSTDQLPAFPKKAADFLKNGCGKGPGLTGKGSQSSGSTEENLSSEADGAVTSGSTTGGSGSSTPSKGASASLRPEFGFAILVATVLGALVL